jgi:methanogenic corrinoid protein MtbC1
MSSLSQQSIQQNWSRDNGIPRSDRSETEELRGRFPADVLRQNVASLAKIIEAEIIPRLMLVHRSESTPPEITDAIRNAVEQEEINEFARLILTHDITVANAYVHAMMAAGLRLDTLYLDLFSPAARRLGELWDQEECDFTQVTMGLWRLQQLLHELSPAFQAGASASSKSRSILLMPAPGEQHTFGLFMVAEFFRRAGWSVWSELPRSYEELIGTVHRHHFAIVGLSVALQGSNETLAECIRGIRGSSKNRSIGVMVGGPMFIQHPEFAAQIGADMTAIDGNKAVAAAEDLLAMQEPALKTV